MSSVKVTYSDVPMSEQNFPFYLTVSLTGKGHLIFSDM